MLTDKEYTLITKKILLYLFKKNKIHKSQLSLFKRDEDVFSNLKLAVMKADWKYNPDKGAKIETWRTKCILWEIYRMNSKLKLNKHKVYNFTDAPADCDMEKLVSDSYNKKQIYYGEIINQAEKILTKEEFDTFIDFYRNGLNINRIVKKHGKNYKTVKKLLDNSVEKIRIKFS